MIDSNVISELFYLGTNYKCCINVRAPANIKGRTNSEVMWTVLFSFPKFTGGSLYMIPLLLL